MLKLKFITSCLFLLYSAVLLCDTLPDSVFIIDNGIISELHKENIGRITFMQGNIPLEEYKEADFLNKFELNGNAELGIRVFMNSSLTNYLHKLAPGLTADELNKNGNFSFTFYVDNKLIYTEDLNPGAGSSENKKLLTVFRVPLISAGNEDSWGRFLWQRFMLRGGEDALTEGIHNLRIEIRPYVKTDDIIRGEMIASGEIEVKETFPEILQEQKEIQQIKTGSGWEISDEPYNKELIKTMNERILQNRFKDITSIVVIKNNKLLLEEYFNGYNRDSLHDTRSVGKSFASALTGIAIKDGYIESEKEIISEFYDLHDYKNFSVNKEKVTLKNLLTMSSAFEGNDFDEGSPGNEENMYPTRDWVKFTLDLPMDSSKTNGKQWNYFTAGVVLLGDILNKSVPGGLEKYSAKKLFEPLGIKNYKWEYTPQGVVNTAGGLRLRSVDYAKFGQLYINEGLWNEKRILSKEWVKSSMTRQMVVNESTNEYYAYLFWNMTFNVNGKEYEAYYSSGNGGNKIFIFKDIPVVVVITSTAYNKPYSHSQVNKMMKEYILPAVIQ